MLQRISKRQAKKLFADGHSCIVVCPCKMRPEGPFSPACTISGKEYLGYAAGSDYSYNLESAWKLMYNNWAFYNTSWETGYYAHYYVEN